MYKRQGLPSAKNCDQERDRKEQHAQPGEQDVEQTEAKIKEFDDPEVAIPFFLFHSAALRSMMEITSAGQTFVHLPQPTHLSSSSRAVTPEAIYSASRGHTAVQQPQATHSLPMPATLGDRFIQGLLCKCISNSDVTNILYDEVLVKCDDETVSMEGRSDWFGSVSYTHLDRGRKLSVGQRCMVREASGCGIRAV